MLLNSVHVPFLGRDFKFQHRNTMRNRATGRAFRHAQGAPPPVTLPVDGTGNAAVSCPIYGNDAYGDCGEAMAAHADQILTFRQGKGVQDQFDVNALIRQYLAVSGGDNGLDEDMVVNQIWKVGIGGNARAVIVDALDIDVTNVPLAQFALDNFYTIQMAWSVPNDFLNGFKTGSRWLNADRPNPNNGHYTPLADVDASGNYRVYTWGSWAWVGPKFVASVQPQCFIAFSPRQFDPATGLDSKGRHVAAQAALWVTCGGRPIPLSVINAFPPIAGPVPPPPPVNPPAPPSPPAQRTTGVVVFDLDGKIATVTKDIPVSRNASSTQATASTSPYGVTVPKNWTVGNF